jgi:glycosyltransferase involved in cell wall biosynthesis
LVKYLSKYLGKTLRLVVVIPAFNEGETVGDVIQNIPSEIYGVEEVLIIVVDDGSIDNTVQVALDAGADYIVRHGINQGVGKAFKDGIGRALELGADIIVNLDADGQHDPADIPRLIESILKEDCDVVVGSRFINDSKPDMPFIKRIGNRIFTELVGWMVGVRFTDTQSGFRAFSREAALRLNILAKFTYTQESLIDLAMAGLRIREIPIQVKPRDGNSRLVKNWYSYGFKATTIIVRIFRDYKPLTFFATPGAVALFAGVSTGIFVFVHWFITGRTSPYRSLVDFTVLSSLTGLFLIFLALIADMQGRQRLVQEEMLYYIKRLYYINTVKKDKKK